MTSLPHFHFNHEGFYIQASHNSYTFFHQFHKDQQTGKHAHLVFKLFKRQSISRLILSHCQTNATKVKRNFNLAHYLTSGGGHPGALVGISPRYLSLTRRGSKEAHFTYQYERGLALHFCAGMRGLAAQPPLQHWAC